MIHDLTDGHPGILNQHQIGGQDYDQNRSHLLDETLDAAVIETDLTGLELIGGDLVLEVQLLLPLYGLTVE